MSEAIPIPLRFPVEVTSKGGDVIERVESVTPHRLSGRDVREILNARAKGDGEMTAVMVCKCMRITPAVFDRMDAEDITALGQVAAGFMGGAPATTSS